jgi:Ankyrin repeats (3 copies)/Ankyrin repeat
MYVRAAPSDLAPVPDVGHASASGASDATAAREQTADTAGTAAPRAPACATADQYSGPAGGGASGAASADAAPWQPDLSYKIQTESDAGLVAVTPLHLASGLGNADVVAALLRHPKAAAQLHQDHTLLSVFVLQTPLHLAVQAGSAAVVEALLRAGHKVDVPSARLAQTALHRAVALGRTEVVRMLLVCKVRARRAASSCRVLRVCVQSCLRLAAAQSGHSPSVRQRPVVRTLMSKCPAVAEAPMLLQANPRLCASVPSGDGEFEGGLTALALLLHEPGLHPPGADAAITKLLLDAEAARGAELPGPPLLEARTSASQRTALHLAVGGGGGAQRVAQRAPVVELLLDRPGVDVNARDALGAPLLLRSCLRVARREAHHLRRLYSFVAHAIDVLTFCCHDRDCRH